MSPGSFPSNITINDVFNGRSEARNRVIAHIFKEPGLIALWGSGINRIINACEEQGLPTPKIEEKCDFFDVEIICREQLPTTSRRKPSNCNEQERAILEYIFENGSIKSKQVGEILNNKESRTRELLG